MGKLGRIFEGELAELKLTAQEEAALRAYELNGWSYNRINREIFGGRYSGRQSIAWIVHRAKANCFCANASSSGKAALISAVPEASFPARR